MISVSLGKKEVGRKKRFSNLKMKTELRRNHAPVLCVSKGNSPLAKSIVSTVKLHSKGPSRKGNPSPKIIASGPNLIFLFISKMDMKEIRPVGIISAVPFILAYLDLAVYPFVGSLPPLVVNKNNLMKARSETHEMQYHTTKH